MLAQTVIGLLTGIYLIYQCFVVVFGDRILTNSLSIPRLADVNRAATVSQSPKPGNWVYDKSVNSSGEAIRKATLTSQNLVQFPFPYAGGSPVMFIIRSKSGSTNAFLEVANGLFTRSFTGGKALVQFDGQKPVTYALAAAANGRGNIVFFEAEQRLIQQLKKSKSVSIKAQFPGQKTLDIQFKYASFQW